MLRNGNAHTPQNPRLLILMPFEACPSPNLGLSNGFRMGFGRNLPLRCYVGGLTPPKRPWRAFKLKAGFLSVLAKKPEQEPRAQGIKAQLAGRLEKGKARKHAAIDISGHANQLAIFQFEQFEIAPA